MNEAQDTEADRIETAALQELARIEKLKGPINPTPAQARFQEQQQQADTAELERRERLMRPSPLPPRVPPPEIGSPDYIAEQKQKLAHERLRERLKGPVKQNIGSDEGFERR